jgi:hypothetical protein
VPPTLSELPDAHCTISIVIIRNSSRGIPLRMLPCVVGALLDWAACTTSLPAGSFDLNAAISEARVRRVGTARRWQDSRSPGFAPRCGEAPAAAFLGPRSALWYGGRSSTQGGARIGAGLELAHIVADAGEALEAAISIKQRSWTAAAVMPPSPMR